MPFAGAVKFRQTARVPENRLWTAMRSLGMAKRTIDRFDCFRIENSLGIICWLRGDRSPLARPFLKAAVKQAYILVAVVHECPCD